MASVRGVYPAISCRVRSPVLEGLRKAVPVSVGHTSHGFRADVGGSLGFAALLSEVRTW